MVNLNFRLLLKRIKTLGVSIDGDGSMNWCFQRISAFGLIPLNLWFVVSFINHIGDVHPSVLNWMMEPEVAILTLLYLLFGYFHAQLGIQGVLKDYIHHHRIKSALLLFSKCIFVLAAVVSIFSIFRIIGL